MIPARSHLTVRIAISWTVIYFLLTVFIGLILGNRPVLGTVVVDLIASTALIQVTRRWAIPRPTQIPESGRALGIVELGWVISVVTLIWVGTWLHDPAAHSQTQARLVEPEWLSVLLAVAIAPVTEELLLRGVWYPALRSHLARWPAAVLNGVIFAAMHLTITHWFFAVTLGIALALTYELTGQLRWSVLGHMTFNLLSIAGARLSVGVLPGVLGQVVMGITALTANGLYVWLLYAWSRSQPKNAGVNGF